MQHLGVHRISYLVDQWLNFALDNECGLQDENVVKP